MGYADGALSGSSRSGMRQQDAHELVFVERVHIPVTTLDTMAQMVRGMVSLRKLDPGEPVSVDPGNLDKAERKKRGIVRFPETLDAALDALQADTVILDAMGDLLATSYIAVKRLESQYCADMTPEEVAELYRYKF